MLLCGFLGIQTSQWGFAMPNAENAWPPAPLLTVKEAAGYFRVSTATVQRWCAAGKLPTCRIGREWRIPWDQLQEHLGIGDTDPDDPGPSYAEEDQAHGDA